MAAGSAAAAAAAPPQGDVGGVASGGGAAGTGGTGGTAGAASGAGRDAASDDGAPPLAGSATPPSSCSGVVEPAWLGLGLGLGLGLELGLGLDVVERRLGHVDGTLPLAVGLAAPLTVHVDSHVEEAGGGHLRGAEAT